MAFVCGVQTKLALSLVRRKAYKFDGKMDVGSKMDVGNMLIREMKRICERVGVDTYRK